MIDIKTYGDILGISPYPEWKVPALSAMTDEALIQELQKRGYVVKKLEERSDELSPNIDNPEF